MARYNGKEFTPFFERITPEKAKELEEGRAICEACKAKITTYPLLSLEEKKDILPPVPPIIERKEDPTPPYPLSNRDVLKELDRVKAEARYWHRKTMELMKPHLDKKRKYK